MSADDEKYDCDDGDDDDDDCVHMATAGTEEIDILEFEFEYSGVF